MITQTLEGIKTRPATRADAEVVSNVINAATLVDYGKAIVTPDEMLHDWDQPGFNLETDSYLMLDAQNQAVGYTQVFDATEPHVRVWVFGRVHPQHRGKGIGSALMDWAEERGKLTIPKAPKDARVFLSVGTEAKTEAAKTLFVNRGYQYVRSFYDMEIDLKAAPPAPEFPAGHSVRTFVPGQDERLVYETLEAGFADHWGFMPHPFEDFMHNLVNRKDFDPTLWFIGMAGDQVTGVALCTPKTTDGPDRAWVDELCVLRPFRRQGVALALLRHAFGEVHRRGIAKAGLGVDTESLTGALRLYERAGMRPVEQFDRYEKDLRPGTELTRRKLD